MLWLQPLLSPANPLQHLVLNIHCCVCSYVTALGWPTRFAGLQMPGEECILP